METIKKTISLEAFQNLLLGKIIDFLDVNSHKVKIQIDGTDVKDFFTKDVEMLKTSYLKNQIKILTRELHNRKECNSNYEAGFGLMMEYFDSISDEEQPIVDKQLSKLGL